MKIQDGANDRQVGGDHYKTYGDIQPWDLWARWQLDGFQATALKYVARWRGKGGADDIRKAIHTLEKYLEEIEAGRVR